MKTVNLEEILLKQLAIARIKFPEEDYYNDEQVRESPEFEYFIGAMKEACRQTLELAAENAETEKEILPECGVLKSVGVVDKQSILDTINQIQ